MNSTATIISLIALILNILTILFIFGYWKGKVDTKICTLWDVYVTSVLVRQTQRNAPAPNPIDLTQLGSIEYHDIGELGFKLITRLTIKVISELALAERMSFG